MIIFKTLVFVALFLKVSCEKEDVEYIGTFRRVDSHLRAEKLNRAYQEDGEWKLGELVDAKDLKVGDDVWTPDRVSSEWKVSKVEHHDGQDTTNCVDLTYGGRRSSGEVQSDEGIDQSFCYGGVCCSSCYFENGGPCCC